MDTTQLIAVGAAVLLVAYHFSGQIKGFLARFTGKRDSPASRIDAVRHLESAEAIAQDMRCDEACQYIRLAGQAMWNESSEGADEPAE